MLQTMRGLVTLHTKQYAENQLIGNPEFLHKLVIHTFVILHYKQYSESQLSVLNNTGSIDSLL